jgi:hypothetical protein
MKVPEAYEGLNLAQSDYKGCDNLLPVGSVAHFRWGL